MTFRAQDVCRELEKTQLKVETMHRVRWRIGRNYVDPLEEYSVHVYLEGCHGALTLIVAANDPSYGEGPMRA